jgi:hypothetical protein
LAPLFVRAAMVAVMLTVVCLWRLALVPLAVVAVMPGIRLCAVLGP